MIDREEHRRLALAGDGGRQVGAPDRVHHLRDDGAIMAARAAGRSDARRREQVVLTHEPQYPAFGGSHPRDAQPRPDLAVSLAVERACREDGVDRLEQRRIRR